MNDLNLTPGAARVKCAKICGDTMGNYHPHGEVVIYPTLVRMAQEWNSRYPLDRQARAISARSPACRRRPCGIPRPACRRSPRSCSRISKLETVDFVPTYDERERRTEPTVLPSKFPNLLVNGANGIAVGMATSIPPHNLGEICDAMIRVIDEPDVSIDELLEIVPGPDFPTGGVDHGADRNPPRLSHGPQHRHDSCSHADRRASARGDSGSSSTRFRSSKPATASRSGSPS